MHYPRAGLVALVFALIISLVSAAPIQATESRLSSTSSLRINSKINGQVLAKPDASGISEYSFGGRMSTLPRATRLTRRPIPTDVDDQLVRRESVGSKIKHAFQKFGQKVKSGFKKAGAAIKSGFQKFGQKVKTGFQKAGTAIKKGFQKVGNGIKTAAKKVWHFVKTTGAKIAKFGLKVVESVGEVVGKVASFIPGIGKPIQQAIHGVSKVAGVISDHIHAKLSKKLEKGMKIMNKADQIMGYIPRRRELSEEEGFQQRDIGEAYYFEERGDNTLENREEFYFEAYKRDIYEHYDLD